MKSAGPTLVIFTDLDGTFLSHPTYQPGTALSALRACERSGIPVVFVSSKTRAEIEELRVHLGHRDPFISENGGAIFLPQRSWEQPHGFHGEGRFWRLALGRPHEALLQTLEKAAAKCGIELETFSSMSLDRVMALTGLPQNKARLAVMREFDEPFLVNSRERPSLNDLQEEIVNRGFQWTRGGRFFHITGDCDKGRAVGVLLNLYAAKNPGLRSAAIGDAANDRSMLEAVDHPFLVRKPEGGYDREAFFERVIVTEGIGPEGFSEAVKTLIEHRGTD